MLSEIDLGVLYIPSSGPELQLLHELSRELKKNIVVYKANYICNGAHLCRTLKPASLSQAQLDRLNTIEKLFCDGQVIVAYEKPLEFADSLT